MQDDSQTTPPSWQFKENGTTPETAAGIAMPTSLQPIEWTASEFVSHEKGSGWYGMLALIGVVTAVVVYMLTRDRISGIMIVIITIVIGVFASRKPRTLRYKLDGQGVHIAASSYPYRLFKSFSVIQEAGHLRSIMLMPLKRLMPPISMYYDPADEDKIATLLSQYLPYEEREYDTVDKLMHKIRL